MAYITLEKYVRLHQSSADLDAGLLALPKREVKTRKFAGIEFVWVPEGWFIAGTRIESKLVLMGHYPDSYRTEVQRVHLGGFWISRTEITLTKARQYGMPNAALGLPRPDLREKPNLASRVPAVLIFRMGADEMGSALRGFLNQLTKAVQDEDQELVADLPTERQWEKAARGDDGRLYPWGNSLLRGQQDIPELGKDASRVALRVRPVGTTAVDVSPYGVRDMVGNVSELVKRSGPSVYYEGRLADFTVVVRGCAADPRGFLEPLVAYRSKNSPVGLRVVLNPTDKAK